MKASDGVSTPETLESVREFRTRASRLTPTVANVGCFRSHRFFSFISLALNSFLDIFARRFREPVSLVGLGYWPRGSPPPNIADAFVEDSPLRCHELLLSSCSSSDVPRCCHPVCARYELIVLQNALTHARESCISLALMSNANWSQAVIRRVERDDVQQQPDSCGGLREYL